MTTKSGALAVLGLPHERMALNAIDERWVYRPQSRFLHRGKTAFLDFAGNTLAGARLLPDSVEDRKGFVVDFSYGWGGKHGRGYQHYNGSGPNVSFNLGYAPHERAALLLGLTGSRHPGATTDILSIGLRVFPVFPWYVQGSYGAAHDTISFNVMSDDPGYPCSSGGSLSTGGGAFMFKAGYEFGFRRTWAWAPELFFGHARMSANEVRCRKEISVSQRATFYGLAARIAWYP
ncbi:MAG: hypothetical protein HY748_08910 [Elusimicrobia bacterium]|nr:hypothetical protein [Elusimicrobiota bacterium]